MDKKLNTDLTENTDLTFSLIFFLNLYSLDLFVDVRRFASACGTPFFWKALDDSLPVEISPQFT